MTITALCLDGDTVRYAGLHQDILTYRAQSGAVEVIETEGVWLGVLEYRRALAGQDLYARAGRT
jgi:hypothetical protein